MGFFGDLWDGLCDVCKTVVSVISDTLKNSVLLQKLLPILSVVIPPPFDAIAVVAIMAISSAMGVEEKPDQLGWKMTEADMKPEDFGSFKEYKEYLDREYPFDQERYDYLSDEQKMACRYVGMAGTMQELKESKGFELTPESLGIIARGAASLNWSNEQIGAFAKGLALSLSNSGAASLSDVKALAHGELDSGKFDSVASAIAAGAKEAGVKQSSNDIIASLQENV